MWFGLDPEVFIVDKDGKAVSAHAIGIPPKWEKVPIAASMSGKAIGHFFRDNYGAEINVSPSICREIIRDRTGAVIRAIRRKASENGCSISSVAAVRMDPVKELSDAPPDVKEWGCNPSYDAYALVAKRPEMDSMTVPVRTAGGHIHLATDNLEAEVYRLPWNSTEEKVLLNPDNYPDVVKLLDAYLGVRATFVFDDASQFERRKIYGQAGEFRPQEYGVSSEGTVYSGMRVREKAMGVEYRTPPPAIFNNEATVAYFLGLARWVVFNFSDLHAKYEAQMGTYVQEAINEGKGVTAMLKAFPVPPSTCGGIEFLTRLKQTSQQLILDEQTSGRVVP